MNEYTIVERDNDRNLRFKAVSTHRASSYDREESNGRWTVLSVYVTAGGKYVCQRESVTQWQGERGTSDAEVYANRDIVDFFGLGRLAKELYAQLDFDVGICETVE